MVLNEATNHGIMTFVFNVDMLIPEELKDLRLKTFNLDQQYPKP